jgi:hypothetical protein
MEAFERGREDQLDLTLDQLHIAIAAKPDASEYVLICYPAIMDVARGHGER